MGWLGELIARRPRTVIAVVIALWLVALAPASRLKLRVDLESLLPDRSAAASGLSELVHRFGGVKRVFVIVADPQDHTNERPELLAEAAWSLAVILRESDEVVEARAGLTDEDIGVFVDRVVRRAPLLMPGEDWLDQVGARLTSEAIHERVQQIHAAVLSPVPLPTNELAVYDPLGFAQDLPVFTAPGFDKLVDPITLSFLSPDNRSALVIVEPRGSELDAAAGRRLQETIDRAAEQLREAMGIDFEIQAVGGPLYAAHDETAIRSDLIRTVITTSVVCGVLIAAVFAGIGIPAGGVVALVVGLTWLAAFLTLVSGGVSAVAIGFSAVLIGLGVDSAIHGGTAFRRHLLADEVQGKALVGAFIETGRPVIAASCTTAAAFAILLASDLPLLRELGLMVAGGIGLVVFATGTIGAAIAVLAAGKTQHSGWAWNVLQKWADRVVSLGSRHPRVTLACAALLTAVTFPAAIGIELDPDLKGLRPEDHPVVEAEGVLAESFGITEDVTTVLVRGRDLDDALARARSLYRGLKQLQPPLVVASPVDRIAGPAEISTRLRKLQTLPIAEAMLTLRREMRASGLNSEAFAPGFESLSDLAAGRDPGGETPAHDDQISFDPNGDVWVATTVQPAGQAWSDEALHELQSVVARSVPQAMIASVPYMGLDLRRIAAHDLRRLSALSLVLVFVVVLVSFRGRVGSSVLALVPVMLGTVWTLGIWSIVGNCLNLVSLAVLPVIIGLGIDDGLYAVHGSAGAEGGGIQGSLARSGRAMVLTTFTTCIGFGSLLLSHLPALQEVAVVIPLGVGACLMATLIVLPAIAAVRGDG